MKKNRRERRFNRANAIQRAELTRAGAVAHALRGQRELAGTVALALCGWLLVLGLRPLCRRVGIAWRYGRRRPSSATSRKFGSLRSPPDSTSRDVGAGTITDHDHAQHP